MKSRLPIPRVSTMRRWLLVALIAPLIAPLVASLAARGETPGESLSAYRKATRSNASPYGAYGMAGNVLEWCQDWYDRDYYAASPGRNPRGPATGAYRVVRGGSSFVAAPELRASARSAAWPSFQGHRMIGFRPVREP